jgi:predicted PurR-regulated permease PerM
MDERPKLGATPSARRKSATIFLYIVLVLSLVLAGLIFRVFWRPTVFAVVIGIGFYPVHQRIRKRIPGRSAPALISTVCVLAIFALCAVFLVSAASGEIVRAAQYLKNGNGEGVSTLGILFQLLDRFASWLERYVDLERTGLRSAIDDLPARFSHLLFATATAIVTGFANILAEGVITLFILFFVFRDGALAIRHVTAVLPVESHRLDRMFSQIRDSVFANLYGILAVALAQGFLAGVAFAVLSIPSPILFGTGAAICSLVPLVGPALVWVPGSIFLFATGHWLKALFLIGWGAIVVGTADNIIRPLVIMGRVKTHPLILLFALIGGVKEFGFAGLFIGPVVVSVIVALVEMLQQEMGVTSDENTVVANPKSPE